MIINDETNEIIGINMIGPQVTELINEALIIAIYEWFSNWVRSDNTCTSFYIRSTYGIGIESRK